MHCENERSSVYRLSPKMLGILWVTLCFRRFRYLVILALISWVSDQWPSHPDISGKASAPPWCVLDSSGASNQGLEP